MTAGGRELLVIVDEDVAVAGAGGLLDRFPVILAAPPRVAVIGVPAGISAADVAALPGVAAATEGDVPVEVLDGLDAAGSLFVRAWVSRPHAGDAGRVGDREAWDADGFEPPDLPSGDGPGDEPGRGRTDV